jgi:hypothetical protein
MSSSVLCDYDDDLNIRDLLATNNLVDTDTATEAASRDKLQSQGVTYHPALPAADKAAIRRSALETWDVLAKETGADAIAYRQKVLDALPK